jgi:hypothetical protein
LSVLDEAADAMSEGIAAVAIPRKKKGIRELDLSKKDGRLVNARFTTETYIVQKHSEMRRN